MSLITPHTHTLAVGLESYAPLGLLVLIAIAFGIINVVIPHLLMWLYGHSRTGPIKEKVYETGMNTIGTAHKRFNIRFYILAMTFLVFDVEIVFLYPWATVFPNLYDGHPLTGQFLFRMLFFVATSVLAYLYAWRKGVFKYD